MARAGMALIPDRGVGRALAALAARLASRRPPRGRPRPASAEAALDLPHPDTPEGSDWAWRPAGFREAMAQAGLAGVPGGTWLCEGVTLFHDCPAAEVLVRQHRQTATPRTAPHGLSVETFHFGGTYLSLALSLPADAVRALTPDHLLTVEARLSLAPPAEGYVRLNLRHGPNLSQITRQMPWAAREVRADFDCGAVGFRPDRLTEVWIDLILDRPEMTRCLIEDVVISRRLRAAL